MRLQSVILCAFLVGGFSAFMALKCLLAHTGGRLAAGWGLVCGAMLLVLAVYFFPVRVSWTAPPEETQIRILGGEESADIRERWEKEAILSEITALSFRRVFFNSRLGGSYDPRRENRALILIRSADAAESIHVSWSDGSGYVETESGLLSKDPGGLIRIMREQGRG